MEEIEKRLLSREQQEKWYANYQKVEAFCSRLTAAPAELEEELARWVERQRHGSHMLPDELKQLLSNLPVALGGLNSWEARYRQLAAFVERNGHASLPPDPAHEVLRDWLNRQVFNRRLLSESQFQQLGSLEVDWDIPLSRDHRWQLMYWKLKDFHRLFGHCRVPQKWENDRQLANWVTVQRNRYAKGKLLEERKNSLEELGFVWNIRSCYASQWEQFYQQLVSFHQKHGHCRVPGKHQKLVSWIERQRTAKTKNRLSADREDRLNKIGFIWSFDNIKKQTWEERYRQLCAYRQKHGHCFVPVSCRENKVLGTWVASQRWIEAKGKLAAAKKKRLDALGFIWSRDTQDQMKTIFDSQWEASFAKLKEYKLVHGTCQVSLKIDPVLQRWTRWQRLLFYQGRLSAERIDRLNEIRFPWSVQESYWMRMYDALVGFRRQFGHTRVPSQWDPDPKLAAWVYRTRRDKQELTKQKVELLDEIGFDWNLSRKTLVPWSDMYGRLLKFQQQHGHTRVPLRWQEDLKLGKWVSRMRHERERLDSERVSLLETIGFYWGSGQEKPAESRKEQIHGLHPA